MHGTLINMLHVDDFFDVGKFKKEDVKLMTTDISVFLHFKFSENVPYLKNGEIVNEGVSGKYFLVRVDVEKILKNSKFYGDARCEAGVTTRFVIPKESLDLFGKIEYTNRDVYCGETVTVVADNDTMKD